MGKKQTSQIPNILLSVKDASVAISVSSKMVRLLIASGRLKAVNLGKRMTRISLQELTDVAQRQGCAVVLPSSSLPFNNNKREKKKSITTAKPETGNLNKRAKCRITPASEKAPEGVTHKTHYTMAEVMSKFNIKYGRLYEIRNRYQLASIHAWGTTAFRKEDVEKAIAKYNEEQGKAQQEAYYTCFDIMQKAELIKCRRTESIINEEFGFLDCSKGQESFLDYFKQCMNKTTNKANWEAAYKHFIKYSGGECRFCDLDAAYCQKFVDYLLSAECYHNGKPMMPTTANNHLVKLKAALRMAYDDGHIKENIAKKLVKAKGHGNKRQYLTKEELVALSKAECKSDVLRRAGLFSCLTGLRLSDCILLQWENIKKLGDGGWVLDITTKKTKTDAILPISEEALALCGDRGEGQVFNKLTPNLVAAHLKDWIKAAGITKHITFHCFRHTFATLQLAGGTDIYTVSKLLTHSNLATTQFTTLAPASETGNNGFVI